MKFSFKISIFNIEMTFVVTINNRYSENILNSYIVINKAVHFVYTTSIQTDNKEYAYEYLIDNFSRFLAEEKRLFGDNIFTITETLKKNKKSFK